MAEIGYIALVLALVASIYSIIAFVISARSEHPGLIASARKSLLAVSVLVTISVVVLLIALTSHQFQIEYVYSYTSSDLPLPYLISALWAGNAGSLLFWGWLLSLFAAVVVLRKRAQGGELIPYASAIIMVTEAFFLIILLFAQNPLSLGFVFHKLSSIPAEGYGLNPLLENPGMIFHPPILLGGYAVFAIPFAFAIAALITRRLDGWTSVIKRWVLLGWLLLGIGNLIGAWWAYVELGWGGYWAWDPVENAGLMPWLVATAFLHSIMLQKRKGMFKLWNTALIVFAFILTIFGTFVTRSDILASVHTFGKTAMGPLFLAFLIITLLGSLTLLFYRRKDLRDESEISSFISRDSTFLLNNLLLVIATTAIFLGTVFGSKQIFFNQVVVPVFLVVLLLSGVCILITWRRPPIKRLRFNLLWPAMVSLIVVIILVICGIRQWYALVAFLLCGFAISAVLSQWFRDVLARSRAKAEGYLTAFLNLIQSNQSRYGGYIVHIAIVIIAIGVIGSSVFDVEKEASLTPGSSMDINNYSLNYEGLHFYGAQNRMIVSAEVSVYKGDRFISVLSPQVYFSPNFEGVGEVAIRSTLTEDLYIILAGWEPIDSEDLSKGYTAGLSVKVNPLVIWIWIGGVIFLIGGLLAFLSERQE
jgi:cytochrome c-type biogenesis protein CcmF